jgi:predicted O-methyltransferase YrrM
VLYQITSYIKFVLSSTNQHGVHSPFVYDLVTRCFKDRKNYDAYATFDYYRKQLEKSNETINVKDFGSGSRVFQSHQRKISQIAKISGIHRKRQQLLFRLVHYFKPNTILELGTSIGMGTLALAKGNENACIITLEGCPETAKIARENFDKLRLEQILSKVELFDEYFKADKETTYDLIYVDGNHNKIKTLSYFQELLKRTHKNSLIIFDDIHWSREMNEAWMEIVRHPKVTVSIDTFFWGFVFFRIEQPKQHFVIRM